MKSLSPSMRYQKLGDAVAAIDLDTLVAKADENLRPFLDAAGGDIDYVTSEPHQDDIDFIGGHWCWLTTIAVFLKSGRVMGNLVLEAKLSIVDGKVRLDAITCGPHELRSMIADLSGPLAIAA